MVMFQGLPDNIGSDCCGEEHGPYELHEIGPEQYRRAELNWTCVGCGRTTLTEAYKNDYNRWTYTDPDGNNIEPVPPNRPRRR